MPYGFRRCCVGAQPCSTLRKFKRRPRVLLFNCRCLVQWGYTGEQSNKITFALSYPKAVLGILVTTGDGIPQNPVDVTLSGATAVGYSSAGCKTYWLAYGI
ncbi:gp53-like domain-containing protein [Phascolarctobacterium succinatutens]|uniref:gp53-like domain-containing protein n=1 Tax=Phascolarctobacterium succinatutens TaxID=626940 RepID=UPI003C6E913A